MHEISLTYHNLFNLDADIDVILSDYKRMGIDGVDFSFDYMFLSENSFGMDFFKKDIDELKEAMDVYKTAFKKHGISVPQTHAPFSSYKFGKDTEEYNEFIVKVIKKCIELTAYLGSKYIVVHPIHNPALPFEKEKEMNIEFYSKLIDDARKSGVIICLENMWSYHSEARIYEGVCTSPYEACDYIDTLNDIAGEELFAFCFDVGHATICGRHMQNTLRILGKRVKTLHIQDTDGERDNHAIPYSFSSANAKPFTDYEGFLAGLHDIGYTGALNFEVCYAFNSFPKATHPALFRLIGAIGNYFKSKINIK